MKVYRLSPGQFKLWGSIIADRDNEGTHLAVNAGRFTLLVELPKFMAKKDPSFLNRKPVDVGELISDKRGPKGERMTGATGWPA